MTGMLQPKGELRDEGVQWRFVFDPVLILSTFAIIGIGALLVYSATRGPATEFLPANRSFLYRQIAYAVVGVPAAVAAATFSVRRIRELSWFGYAGLTLLLLGILLFGAVRKGAQSWFELGSFTIQPSEPGKVVVILLLAAVLSQATVAIREVAIALVLAGVPMVLILAQPDLGTVLVYIFITASMILVSNASSRVIVFLSLLSVSAVTLIFRSGMLQTFQKDRLTVFLLNDEAVAELGPAAERVAYNAKQAQIAIGNGGIRGTGLFQGTQTGSNLVPEQHHDFIFSVAGEELGFLGAGLLLTLFSLLVIRMWRAAVWASDEFDRLVAVGVMAMFVYQVFQSVGMTMGMMPVTGIPLPLVSYGGSSMVTSLVALGLVHGIYQRRYEYSR